MYMFPPLLSCSNISYLLLCLRRSLHVMFVAIWTAPIAWNLINVAPWIVDLTVIMKSVTVSKAGLNLGSVLNSDSNMRSRSSWSPVVEGQIFTTRWINLSKLGIGMCTLSSIHLISHFVTYFGNMKRTKFGVFWVGVQPSQNMWNGRHGFTKVFHLVSSKRACRGKMGQNDIHHPYKSPCST